jgi:hypothetical protein
MTRGADIVFPRQASEGVRLVCCPGESPKCAWSSLMGVFSAGLSDNRRENRTGCVGSSVPFWSATSDTLPPDTRSSSPSKLINQTSHHAPPPRLPLLPTAVSLHARSSTRLTLHPPPQTVVSLFLLRASHKPRGNPPPRRPRQNLSSVRKPNDPPDTRRNHRARKLREGELHG